MHGSTLRFIRWWSTPLMNRWRWTRSHLANERTHMIPRATPHVSTHFAASGDGIQIAYDLTGNGPAVILLHGGGQTRRIWHDAGYVERLAQEFTVITVDLRGNGESDKPVAADAYSVDHVTADILAVADATGASVFSIWGFSYGANVGRYVAMRSARVRSMIYVGIPFGAAAPGAFRQYIVDGRAKWTPIVEAARAGKLDEQSLSEADRLEWRRGTVPVSLAWLSAMLAYPPVEPRDMPCPTLWIVGTANLDAIESVKAYEPQLVGTRVTVMLLEGLTHAQEQERIDVALPKELEFTRTYQ